MPEDNFDIEYLYGEEQNQGGPTRGETTETPSSSSAPYLEFSGAGFTSAITPGYGTSDSTGIPNTINWTVPTGGTVKVIYHTSGTSFSAFTLSVGQSAPLTFAAAGTNQKTFNGTTSNSSTTLVVGVTSSDTSNDLTINYYASNNSSGTGRYLVTTKGAVIGIIPSTGRISYTGGTVTLTVDSNVDWKISELKFEGETSDGIVFLGTNNVTIFPSDTTTTTSTPTTTPGQ